MGYITFYQFVSENVINMIINNLLNCMTITVLIFCVHPLTLLALYLCRWRVLDQSVPINLGSRHWSTGLTAAASPGNIKILLENPAELWL